MKMKLLFAASTLSVAAAFGVAAPAAAQQITTGIEGTVNDDAGNAIANATVTVTDTRTGVSRTLTTGSNGTFSATNLITGGPYTVTAAAEGFEGQTISGLNTTLQGNTGLTFNLTTGGGAIIVSASRVRVTTLATGPGTSFTSEVLEAAPTFNRDVRDIIRIDPRVSLDRDDGGSGQDRISCLGGNDRGNAFTVDGISQGDVYGLNDTGFSSRSSTPLPYDAVRETQVQFAPFDVQYANFTGCAINVVTKSGGNDYHGTAFFEYSDSGMRGTRLPNAIPGGPDVAVAPIKPDKRWGASLGGPIIKDTLFLYGAYEHQEAGQSQDDGPAGAGYPNSQAGVPVAAFNEISQVLSSVYGIETGPLVTNRPFTNDRYFARADWQITDGHRLEATYQRMEEASVRADDLFTGNSPQAVGENTFYLSGTKSNYYSGRFYSQWSDSFSTELRYSRSEVVDRQDPIGGGEAQSGSPIYRIIVGIDNPAGTVDGTVMAGPGSNRSANDLQTTVEQYRAVGTWDAGDHKVKFGAELNRADIFNLFVSNATGTLVFRNINDLRAGLLSPGTGNNQTSTTPANVVSGATEGAFINYTVNGDINEAAAAFKRDIFSVFVQDEVQASDRLSAVFGLRVDWFRGDAPQLNTNFVSRYGFANTTGFDDLGTLFMPRVGATYEMDDFAVFARPKLTGGLGIFSGGDPLVWFGNAFQNDGISFAQGSTQGGTCAAGQIDVVTNGTFTGIPTCALTNASTSAARGLGFTQAIDPNIKPQSVLRGNLGFSAELNFTETGFFSGWNLNLDYIWSRYLNPYNVVDLSQVPNPTRGLNGFAIDGRPVYVTIDPTNAGCSAQFVGATPTPVYNGVTAACITTSREDELMLTNARGFNSQNASFILSKYFNGGLFTSGGSSFVSLGYAWSGAKDRRAMYNSTAGSNYDITAAADRQNPAASRGFYSSKHNFTLSTSFAEEFVPDLETRFGVTFVARSGRPYSLTFTGGSVFNDNASGTDNALVYLPSSITDPNLSPLSNMTEVQKLIDFAKGLDCAKGSLGQTIERNTCSNDWYFDLDLSLSQEIPGPGSFFGMQDKLKLFASFDNFLNFLDSDWNVQHRRDFGGRQDIATTTGVDAQGRYIITSASGTNTFASDNAINVSSSVWRLKVGVSYKF
ncbi:MAG: TonB-dependent receptor [Croceibacterium sp.]